MRSQSIDVAPLNPGCSNAAPIVKAIPGGIKRSRPGRPFADRNAAGELKHLVAQRSSLMQDLLLPLARFNDCKHSSSINVPFIPEASATRQADLTLRNPDDMSY